MKRHLSIVAAFLISAAPAWSQEQNNLITYGQVAGGGGGSGTITINTVPCTVGSSCTISAASSLVVGASTITSGTPGDFEFNNGGILGEVAPTGTGSVVLATNPTIAAPTFTGTVAGAGTIPNAVLANSAITIGSTNVALGGVASTISGLTLASPIFSGTVAGAGTIPNTVLANSSITIGSSAVSLGGTISTINGALTFGGANAYGIPASITLTHGTGLPLLTGVTGVLPSANGGVGFINGLIKADGTGLTSKAISGSDYAPATSGTSILLGNGAGGFSNILGVTSGGTGMAFGSGDLTLSTITSSLLKTDAGGVVQAAVSGTDYSPAGAVLFYSSSQSVTAGQFLAYDTVISTAAITLTYPLTSSLSNNGGNVLSANGGAITVTPNASDQICVANVACQTAGTTYVLAQGSAAIVNTQALGKLYIQPMSSAGGGGSGTVTSVAMTMPGAIFNTTVSGSPITSSGTFAPALLSQTANTFFGAPDGSSGTPTFRALLLSDLPASTVTVAGNSITLGGSLTATTLTASLNQFSSSLQGVVPSSGGGTTNFLRADGTWAAPGASTPTSPIGGSGSSQAGSTTKLYGPFSSAAGGAGTNIVAALASKAMTFSQLYCSVATAPSVGQTDTFTLFVNSIATSVVCTISGTNTTANDTTHTATITAGQNYYIQLVTSAGAATTNGEQWGFTAQ